jgi:hypothetical protein
MGWSIEDTLRVRSKSESRPQSRRTSSAVDRWDSFEEILDRLHREGIYIHSEQLAEFLLYHGLPVDLQYVPVHLQQKAMQINQHYQGDMARLDIIPDVYSQDI